MEGKAKGWGSTCGGPMKKGGEEIGKEEGGYRERGGEVEVEEQ